MKKYFFVYGSLKNGFWNNHVLRDSIRVGKAVTKAKFLLTDVGFPYMVPEGPHTKATGHPTAPRPCRKCATSQATKITEPLPDRRPARQSTCARGARPFGLRGWSEVSTAAAGSAMSTAERDTSSRTGTAPTSWPSLGSTTSLRYSLFSNAVGAIPPNSMIGAPRGGVGGPTPLQVVRGVPRSRPSWRRLLVGHRRGSRRGGHRKQSVSALHKLLVAFLSETSLLVYEEGSHLVLLQIAHHHWRGNDSRPRGICNCSGGKEWCR